MKRRQFLQITAIGTVGLSLPGTSWLSGQPSRWQAFAYPELLTLLDNKQRVREIGSVYRCVFPKENAPETLMAAIMSDSGISEDLADSMLRARLDQQIRNDFAQGHTVQLKGWILSVNEARQCALYSMVTS